MKNTKFEMWLDEVNQKRKEYWEKTSIINPILLTVKKGKNI